MLDHNMIEDRLKEIRKRRELLEEYRLMDRDTFIDDLKTYELALRHLQVAIQTCIDVALHIAAVHNFEAPDQSSKIFTVLSQHDILDEDLAARLNQAGAVHNIIVHQYMGIDLSKIHQHLQTDLDDLDRFVVSIGQYLKS